MARVKDRLSLPENSSILEVGCGCGAFLLPFVKDGVSVYGIDYADKLIAIARQAIPSGSFQFASACAIPHSNEQFDAVVSNAVFFYFPDYDYAERSLREILRVLKPGGTAAILDISNLNSFNLAEELRAREIGPDEYNRLYVVPKLRHLYFDPKWFANIGASSGANVSIEDQSIDGYLNSTYRFNVYLTKLR